MKKFFSFVVFSILVFFSCKHKDDDTQNQIKPTPPTRPDVACKVSILNQVNGDYVEGLTLSIYEAGTQKKVFEEVVSFGFVYPKLEEGKNYDLAVRGDKTRASSFIKNLRVKTANDDIAIVCLTKAQNTRDEAFIELKEFKWKYGSDEKTIEDGVTIDSPVRGRILAKVVSSSAAIYKPLSYGFAARIGLGLPPTTIGGLLTKGSIQGDIKEYPKYEDNEWTSEVSFECGASVWESFTNEEQDIIAVFYDATGNRLEVHNHIIVKPTIANFTEYTGDKYILKDFHIETKTYKSYNQAYSVGSKDNTPPPSKQF